MCVVMLLFLVLFLVGLVGCRVDVRTKWESSIIGTDDDNDNIMLTQQRNEMRTEHQRDHGIWYHGLKENTNNGQTMVGSNKQTTLSART